MEGKASASSSGGFQHPNRKKEEKARVVESWWAISDAANIILMGKKVPSEIGKKVVRRNS